MLFRKKIKCQHEYDEIGRYYFEEGYSNKDIIHACVVNKCKNCGEIYKEWVYEKGFLPDARIEKIHEAVKTLEKHGFVKELDFIISQIGR